MKKFAKLYWIEQKLAFRSADTMIFGIAMPIGVLFLIAVVAGQKTAGGSSYTFLESAFASLIAVGICACAFMGLPLTIADYRDKKILKHFFVTPCSPVRMLGANVLCSAVMAILSAVAVVLVSVFVFGYRMQGNVLVFVGMWFLTLISMLSIGLLMASLCRTVKAVNAITSLVYFPMLFLSGATIPFELFPEGLQKVASVLPLTQGIKLMKEASMGIQTEGFMWRVALLTGITVVCTLISVRIFRWE
ncbi:MAG: ABC transporter permease [Lachnospiraceae bacterium]|nr:ABC transporter permease [Lachnospiraceae bacterium]